MFGMRRLSVCALVSVILVATLSAGGAAKAETVNIRPISDWTSVRPAPTGNWTGPADQLPEGYFAVFYRFAGAPADGVDMSRVRIDGKVIERRLESGDVEVTVRLQVSNAPLTIYGFQDVQDFFAGTAPFPTPVLGAGADGSIDYRWEIRLIVADFDLPLVPANFRDTPRISTAGNGAGHFTSYAANFGYTPGATGEVHIMQIGLFAVAEHANGMGLADAFPGELITLRETGR